MYPTTPIPAAKSPSTNHISTHAATPANDHSPKSIAVRAALNVRVPFGTYAGCPLGHVYATDPVAVARIAATSHLSRAGRAIEAAAKTLLAEGGAF